MRALILGAIFSIAAVPAWAGSEDPELDARAAVDHATIEGVSYLVLCEDALRPDYSVVWQANRDRIILAIREIIVGEDRALLRYDDLYTSARESLAAWEDENPSASPRIKDAGRCLSHFSDNEHATKVAVAKLRQLKELAD